MKPYPSLISLAIASALALPSPSQAIEQDGSAAVAASMAVVVGQITESTKGVALAGAIVRMGGHQAVSDANGQFRINGVTAGTHTLTVDYLGYQRHESQVDIGASGTVRSDITLRSVSVREAGDLDAVVVRGSRTAQARALNEQRGSTNYVNVVSADLLGTFPDNNIAESTQRITGVSIERDQGEGRYVTVRGAPKEFTTVSIDGVPLANPDSASRGVELDTIPSDVIAALKVTKALTPDMDADAIAGNIDIRTQSALNRNGMTLRASAASGRYQLGNGVNQRFNATIGQRFGADKNIGILISGSSSKQGRFTDNVETLYSTIKPNGIVPTEVQIKDYDGTRTRTGLTARFDLRINADHLLHFVASNSRFRDHEFRDNLVMAMDQHTAASNEVTGNVRATFDKELRERTYDKTIRTFNLGGEHHFADVWQLDWQASRSSATKTTSPRMQYIFRSTVRPKMDYDYGNYEFPTWKILGRADAPATGVNVPESWYAFRRLNDRYEYGTENETGLRLDLKRAQEFIGTGEISFGARARLRDKSFDDERKRNGSAADFAKLGIKMSDMLCNDVSNNFDYFNVGRKFCQDIFTRYAGPLISSSNHLRLMPDSITGDYKAKENVYGGYVRLDAQWDALTLVTGLRYERTHLEGNAVQVTLDNAGNVKTITPRSTSHSYGNLFPSAHLRYTMGEDSILRASYSTALNRPDFIHTAPYRTIGELESSPVMEGNPDLKPAFAHNFDLSYEHYLRPLGLVSAAVFLKQLKDPVFIASSNETTVNGVVRQVTRPENGKNGRIYGFELAWQQTMDFLPSPFDGLGLYTNYTYTRSSAELPFGLGKTELPGTSRHNYNIALGYEKYGLTTRLSYNHRSKFIQAFDIDNPQLNVYWNKRSSLDFSASYAVTKNWRIFGEANNLNNTRQTRFQGKESRVLEMEGFGRSWLLGVRFEL